MFEIRGRKVSDSQTADRSRQACSLFSCPLLEKRLNKVQRCVEAALASDAACQLKRIYDVDNRHASCRIRASLASVELDCEVELAFRTDIQALRVRLGMLLSTWRRRC